MVYMEFVSDDGAEVIYDYMPETKDAPKGTVSVNRKTGERKLIKRSPDGEWSAYHSQAWKRIEQMIADGTLKRETSSAWY